MENVSKTLAVTISLETKQGYNYVNDCYCYLFILKLYLAAVTYNQVQPLRINYLAS